MAFWTYTLTGFGDFLEQRRVAFTEPMPADRICSICGRIPSNAVHLPCAHISCLRCKVDVCDAKQCPLDGTAVTEKELIPFETDACYLERRRAVCVVDGRKCSSNFSGKLSELKRHLASYRSGDLHCAKCNRPVAREAAAEHYRKCCETSSALQSATDVRVRKAVEEIRGIKEDLESLRQKALNERDSEDKLVSRINGLVGRLANLDRSLSVAQETVADAHREGNQSSKPPAPRPLRTASKPGLYIPTSAVFKNVYAAYDSLLIRTEQRIWDDVSYSARTKRRQRQEWGRACTPSGYTFCTEFRVFVVIKGGREQVRVMFVICLQAGEWDEYVEWPCSKKFALAITHPRDETNDIRLALCIDRDKAAKKPCPSRLNEDGYRTKIT